MYAQQWLGCEGSLWQGKVSSIDIQLHVQIRLVGCARVRKTKAKWKGCKAVISGVIHLRVFAMVRYGE
jgi:hypothetical protein